MSVPHPETGEALSTREEIMDAMKELDERMSPLYAARRALRDAYLQVSQPAALPSRRSRTDTQERVARCPRCGGRLEIEEGGA